SGHPRPGNWARETPSGSANRHTTSTASRGSAAQPGSSCSSVAIRPSSPEPTSIPRPARSPTRWRRADKSWQSAGRLLDAFLDIAGGSLHPAGSLFRFALGLVEFALGLQSAIPGCLSCRLLRLALGLIPDTFRSVT